MSRIYFSPVIPRRSLITISSPTRSKKIQFPSKKKYKFDCSFAITPHPDKIAKGGEDAAYVSENFLIVADGVSGWSEMGVDAGAYARTLVNNVKQLVQTSSKAFFIKNPRELAVKAVRMTNVPGSATLSIMTLDPIFGLVRSYHIGDSIYGIFLGNDRVIVGQEQCKAFNTPFQVNSGDQMRPQYFLGEPIQSDLLFGITSQFSYDQMKKGFIVLGSDGLWDNVHLKDISMGLFRDENASLTDKVTDLMQVTKHFSQLNNYASPFYLKACRYNFLTQKQGKLDDITIVIAKVVQQ